MPMRMLYQLKANKRTLCQVSSELPADFPVQPQVPKSWLKNLVLAALFRQASLKYARRAGADPARAGFGGPPAQPTRPPYAKKSSKSLAPSRPSTRQIRFS
jgi:hypothetical protein